MKTDANCHGCHDDFYNGRQNFDGTVCWSLDDAVMKTRYRLNVHTRPTEPGAFEKQQRPSCYRQQGFVFYDKLPSFVGATRG